MTLYQLTTKLLSARAWPIYLVCIITVLAESLNAVLNIINSLAWYGRIDADLLVMGSINALVVTMILAPAIIYMIRHSFNLEEVNRRLQEEIDERAKTEAALRQNEKLLRMVTDNSRDIIWIVDMAWRFTYLSPAVKTLLGYTAEEFLKLDFRQNLTVDSYHLLLTSFAEEMAMEEAPEKDLLRSRTVKVQQIRKDGVAIWVEMKTTFLRDADGKPIGILGFSRDITAHKKAEEALRNSEEQYRLLFENIHDVVYSFDPNLKILSVSPSIEKHLGYPAEAFIGKYSHEINIFTKEDLERGAARMMRYLQGERLPPEEFEVVGRDGSIKYSEISGSPIIRDGQIIGIIAVARDITERKLAEAAAKETEERYRTLADNIPDIIYSLDGEGRFTTISENALRRYGYSIEEIAGNPIWALSCPEDQESLSQAYEDAREHKNTLKKGLQFRAAAKDGALHWFELNAQARFDEEGRFLREDGVLRDITAHKEAEAERARLEEQLSQMQRLEAVGTLAGGIAHDFNNLLMGIQGFASLILMEIEDGHPHYEKLKNIERQVHSGADLTRQLLGFARKGRYEVQTTNLNEIVKKTADMFGRTKKEITIHSQYDGEIWPVEIDRGQVEQVLLNLYVNAWQAMPAGGDLFLETRNVYLDESYTRRFSLTPGRYVKLSVTDTGIGMDEKTKGRIFEPFFTTKEMGRGTGLGLAMVYGIMKGHKGTINVYSERGSGTTFNTYLPSSERAVTEKSEALPEIKRGHETILLVDDEDTILTVSEKLLKNLGYRTITANRGLKAVEIYRAQKSSIDLVLLDMIMPGMNGNDTFDQLIAIDPHLKVILSSGYSLNDQAHRILKKGCRGFIQKPFNIAELSQIIRAALDQ
jgi:PAS domain S-box-containing protein